jgi:hypothetical protein
VNPAFPVIFLGIPWILGWIFKANLSHQRYMKVLQLKAELNSRLLDRAASDPGLLEYLKGDAQQQMFDVKVPETAAPAPYMRALTAAQASFLLLSAGTACAWFSSHGDLHAEAPSVFLFFGTLGIALGIGSLLSAAAAFIAARLWHTLNKPA